MPKSEKCHTVIDHSLLFSFFHPWYSTFHQVLLYFNPMFIRFITDTSLLSTLKPWSCLSHVFLHSVTPSTVRASLVLSHRFIPLLCKAARSSRPVLCTLASSFYCFHFFQYIQNIRLNFLQCYIPKAIPLLRNLLWTGSYPQLWGTFRGSPVKAHSSSPSSSPTNL